MSTLAEDIMALANDMKYVFENGLAHGAGIYYLPVKYVSAQGIISDLEVRNAMNTLNNLQGTELTPKDILVIKLPEDVEEISGNAFSSNNMFFAEAFDKVKTIIPLYRENKIRSISGGFKNCSALKIVDLRNVKILGAYSFENCKLLETVNLENASYVAEEAFKGCDNLRNVYLGERLEPNGKLFVDYTDIHKTYTFDTGEAEENGITLTAQCITNVDGEPILLYQVSRSTGFIPYNVTLKIPNTVRGLYGPVIPWINTYSNECKFIVDIDVTDDCYKELGYLGLVDMDMRRPISLILPDLQYDDRTTKKIYIKAFSQLFTGIADTELPSSTTWNKAITSNYYTFDTIEIKKGDIPKNSFRNVDVRKVKVGIEGDCKIQESAFRGSKIDEFYFGPYVTSIDIEVFYSSSRPPIITVDENNQYLLERENLVYTKDGKTLIVGSVRDGEKDTVIPDDVEVITAYAFTGNYYLTSIVIGKNVREIGMCVFRDTPKLKNFSVHEDNQFFEAIETPGWSSSHTTLYEKNTKTLIGVPTSLSNDLLIIADGTERIASNVFYKFSSTNEVDIPASIKSIDKKAFSGVDGLIVSFRGEIPPGAPWGATSLEIY